MVPFLLFCSLLLLCQLLLVLLVFAAKVVVVGLVRLSLCPGLPALVAVRVCFAWRRSWCRIAGGVAGFRLVVAG